MTDTLTPCLYRYATSCNVHARRQPPLSSSICHSSSGNCHSTCHSSVLHQLGYTAPAWLCPTCPRSTLGACGAAGSPCARPRPSPACSTAARTSCSGAPGTPECRIAAPSRGHLSARRCWRSGDATPGTPFLVNLWAFARVSCGCALLCTVRATLGSSAVAKVSKSVHLVIVVLLGVPLNRQLLQVLVEV